MDVVVVVVVGEPSVYRVTEECELTKCPFMENTRTYPRTVRGPPFSAFSPLFPPAFYNPPTRPPLLPPRSQRTSAGWDSRGRRIEGAGGGVPPPNTAFPGRMWNTHAKTPTSLPLPWQSVCSLFGRDKQLTNHYLPRPSALQHRPADNNTVGGRRWCGSNAEVTRASERTGSDIPQSKGRERRRSSSSKRSR